MGYIILIVVLAVLMGRGAIVTTSKAGEKEGICKYGYDDE